MPEAQTANVTYRVDPSFIFSDSFNNASYTPGTNDLKIDFGDGTGWHIFAGNTVQYHSASYNSGGVKIIKVAIFTKAGVQLKLSTSKIYTSGITLPVADSYFTLSGMNVGVFAGCTDDNIYNKVVIVCEGFDMMDFIPSQNRNAAMIYLDRIKTPELSQLKNFGYTFLIVDWLNSRIDIRDNAMNLVNLIDHLKCTKMDSDNDQQFVVIGESMGGLVARYALCYMETQFYVAPCKQSQMHNTRLLMTFDTPHRGASIPLSYQWLYKDALKIIHMVVPISTHQLTHSGNLFLGSTAAKQMLLYHVDTYNPLFPGPYFPYQPHPERALFLNDLASIGNYPQYCKKFALSDGSLSGKRQTNDHSGTDRVANDAFVDFDANLHVNILHQKIKIFGAKLKLLSNPNGSSEVYRAEAGTWALRLKVKWFGIKVTVGLSSLMSSIRGAVAKDFCTSAGGIYSLMPNSAGALAGGMDQVNSIFFKNHSFTSLGSGNYVVSASSRPYWFGAGATVHSQGMHFGFVPTYSGIDYSTGDVLNYNIETELIAIKNTKTAWDVIMGVPNSLTGASAPDPSNILKNQREHALPTNYNLGIALGTTENYRSCITPLPSIGARVLAREIGDEEMWLDNMLLNRRAMYESEYDIYVNGKNPYYEYLGQPNLAFDIIMNGVYSKSNPFLISPITGEAIFKYDDIFTYDPPGSGTFQLIDAPLPICCQDFKSFSQPQKESKTDSGFSLKIFPNPLNADLLWITYCLEKTGSAKLKLVSLFGQTIHEKVIASEYPGKEEHLSWDLSAYDLQKGMYLVLILSGNKVISQKLILE